MNFKEFLEENINNSYKKYRETKDKVVPLDIMEILKEIIFLEKVKKIYKCWEDLYGVN